MMRRGFAWCVGGWLASVQVGYFLLLETHVTAAALVYFLMVGLWLGGAIIGLSLPRSQEAGWLIAAVGTFYLAAATLRTVPDGWTGYAALACVVIGGIYSGQFFVAQRRLFAHSGELFLWENTGFLVGWVSGIGVWLWAGEQTLLWMPALWLMGVLAARAALRLPIRGKG